MILLHKFILFVLLSTCFLEIFGEKKPKKSSERLKKMMEQKEAEDKIKDEQIRQQLKEREEKIASRYKPGSLFEANAMFFRSRAAVVAAQQKSTRNCSLIVTDVLKWHCIH